MKRINFVSTGEITWNAIKFINLTGWVLHCGIGQKSSSGKAYKTSGRPWQPKCHFKADSKFPPAESKHGIWTCSFPNWKPIPGLFLDFMFFFGGADPMVGFLQTPWLGFLWQQWHPAPSTQHDTSPVEGRAFLESAIDSVTGYLLGCPVRI